MTLEEFARFSAIGTWGAGAICPVCGRSTEEILQPLQVQWEPGPANIADFSWSGYTTAVSARARQVLQQQGFECEFGSVEVMPPAAEETDRVAVPFPYTGPSLSWLMPTELVPLHEVRTGITGGVCVGCQVPKYPFRRKGIVVENRNLGGRKMFRISQFGGSDATFVTEIARDTLLSAGLTNLGMHEAGSVL